MTTRPVAASGIVFLFSLSIAGLRGASTLSWGSTWAQRGSGYLLIAVVTLTAAMALVLPTRACAPRLRDAGTQTDDVRDFFGEETMAIGTVVASEKAWLPPSVTITRTGVRYHLEQGCAEGRSRGGTRTLTPCQVCARSGRSGLR